MHCPFKPRKNGKNCCKWPKFIIITFEPVPVRPEPAPERPEMIALLEAQASLREAFGQRGDGWMDGQTDIQIPPVFNRTSSPFGDEAQKGLKMTKIPFFAFPKLC